MREIVNVSDLSTFELFLRLCAGRNGQLLNLSSLAMDEHTDESDENEIPLAESVDTIRRNGEHLLAVINQILDISKLEAGEIFIAKAVCSPLEILEDVAALAELQTEAKKLEFELTRDSIRYFQMNANT